jgi:hypothetical protein
MRVATAGRVARHIKQIFAPKVNPESGPLCACGTGTKG